MEKDMNLPILIYVAKENCPGCEFFNKEWEQIKADLYDQIRAVKFEVKMNPKPLPPCIADEVAWFPTILLTTPRSYFRCFTTDDRINEIDYQDDYKLKVFHYDAVRNSNGKLIPEGSSYKCDMIKLWFQIKVKVLDQINEKSAPSMYPNLQ